MMIATLLLQSFIATPQPVPRKAPLEPVVALLSAEDDEFELAAFLRPGDSMSFPLPFSSRSERVARAQPGRYGIALGLMGTGCSAIDAVRVQAIPHAPDSQVLVSQEGAVWVGPLQLPRSVSIKQSRELLPLLARQDGVGVQDCIISIEPPRSLAKSDRLFLIPTSTHAGIEWFTFEVREMKADGKWSALKVYSLRPTTRSAIVLETEGGRVQVHLTTVSSSGSHAQSQLDQVFYASAQRVDEFTARDLVIKRAELEPITASRIQSSGGVGPRTRVPHVAPPSKDNLLVTDVISWSDEAAVELERDTVLRLWIEDPVDHSNAGESWTLLVSLDPKPLGQTVASPRDLVELREGIERSDRILGAELAPTGWLVDVAASEGVAVAHLEGPANQVDIRPTMGPGAAFGDVDGDGNVDLYLVQGKTRAGSFPLSNRLFLNRGVSFRDYTTRSKTGDTGAGMGALFFDPDGDGDLDLYVANYGEDVYYANGGTGVFLDATAAVGITGSRWSASAVAGDADQDGDLDLYVTSYLLYDLEALPTDRGAALYNREDPVEMLPFAFPGEANVFYRNDGFIENGRVRNSEFKFADLTEKMRLSDRAGKGMQSAFWDFDQDGDQDLYIANDVTPNLLMRNEGKGQFRDVSFSTGMDDPRGGMGIAIGDIDGDQDEDLFLTNWELESNALYVNNLRAHSSRRHRVGTFRDRAVDSGFRLFGVGFTSWGAQFFDLENDGDLDLFVANGYTSPDYESTGICVGQPNHLFLNSGEGKFEAALELGGLDLAIERASRCAIACDYDQDGAVELLVTSNNGMTQLLDNRADHHGSWVGIRLNQSGANRFGIGATVEVLANGETWMRTLRAGTGYLGGNAPELHFGLGAAETIDLVRVRWPDGTSHEYEASINSWQTVRRQ